MKKTSIAHIFAREILDSRGNPTIEATVTLADGSVGIAAVPSGASTGAHEAVELRDGAKRYGGKGVLKAVKHVNTLIAKELKGHDALHQRALDQAMIALDGTPQKKKLGANAILSVSLAACRAAAASTKIPLYAYIRKAYRLPEKKWIMPLATMNVINGGRHANNGLSIQEFMIVPKHKLFKERVRMGSQIFHTLGQLLAEKKFNTGVGDEGGYAPEFTDNEQALKFLMKAISTAGFEPGRHVMLAMDVAASEFYKSGNYYFLDKHVGWRADKVIRMLEGWTRKYPFISIEDPLAEDDWDNWKIATKKLGKKVHVVGDDLFVTNTERIQKGIDEKVGNAVLIKLNQIGTLSETIDAIYLARKHGYAVSVSHRSGETADTFIADLSVAVNAEYIKSGSMSRSERVEKYNRLMQIEDEVM
ncbi:MAG: phosphopyruvate hydratase [Candidatus Magasanikbacteria bacterium CG_4_10_14_0_2_um_filter_41_31]|uniref:Enolase n=1 Tax=Candidatus Magasanikbacteria bacterium CG_4_10_14_0_2_um_filter_41_31 TaxID=1974639 RepID=A0A2M7V460_9BACT|nr:MAG: phosphopyruvate hydratase [Candidatus Magasanikbacteria bacterium CG_4_10_14_0_2_um_filter_41_31]